ncbi:MAG: PQQ-binding-like beta-propeller repeat protein [Planctomycetaceae bacterium]|nr:PQQ-binding-like beta-propeller repeat protein [Planctomycetaceae bacterium]
MKFFSLLLLALSTANLPAADWNQFRGSAGDGQSTVKGIPTTWSETSNVAWKTAIWGKGWSSPVIWKDQVWLTTATPDGHRLAAVCVDRRNGKILHDITVFEHEKPQYCHPFNSYASPTPWVEENRVYVHFGALGTACLDTRTGKTIWKRQDLPCNHFRGPGSSVVIHGNHLFLPYDGFDYQYVVALDKRNGKTAWRNDRNVDYGSDNGDVKKAYGTAKVITFGGRTQVVVPGAVATMSYDPESGKELWRVIHGGMNSCARPLFGNGLLYINTGSVPTRLLAVRPDGKGDITKTHVKWTTMKSVPSRPSQLLVGDAIYMVSNSGVASCLAAGTGKAAWTKRIAGKHVASPILVGKRIFSFSQEGRTHVFAADKATYRELAVNKLDGGFMASPAVAKGLLILRTKTHLYGISGKK